MPRRLTGKFDWLSRDIVQRAAAKILASGEIPAERRSVHFDLIINDKALPPKYVITEAARLLKRDFTASNFAGGEGEANRVLRDLGFEIRDRRNKGQPRSFIQYWRPAEVKAEIQREKETGRPLTLIGGRQLRKVRPGDIVWIVTKSDRGGLNLCGRVTVAEVLGHGDASKHLGYAPSFTTEYYAVARGSDSEPMRLVDITDVVPLIRFIPDKALTINRGSIRPQELQSIRLLSSSGVLALEDVWLETAPVNLSNVDRKTLNILNAWLDDDVSDLDEEGRRIYRSQQFLERSRRNRQRVLAAKGHVCEVCGYDFERQFPGFQPSAQVHHKRPLGAGKRQAQSIDEFAVLCAPCHTAAHMGKGRKLKPWTIAQLRRLISRRWTA